MEENFLNLGKWQGFLHLILLTNITLEILANGIRQEEEISIWSGKEEIKSSLLEDEGMSSK